MTQKNFFINKSLVLKTKNTLTFLIVTYFRYQNALHGMYKNNEFRYLSVN